MKDTNTCDLYLADFTQRPWAWECISVLLTIRTGTKGQDLGRRDVMAPADLYWLTTAWN